jgi:hypothetical protein
MYKEVEFGTIADLKRLILKIYGKGKQKSVQ